MVDRPSIEAQIIEVRRELAIRENLYPNWIRQGKLKADEAVRRIEVMAEVLRTLTTVQQMLRLGQFLNELIEEHRQLLPDEPNERITKQ